MIGAIRSLYLIRHGATEANLRRPPILQGRRIDLPLSELGRQQAEAAGRALERRSLQAVFSSPLRRAVETAGIIARSHRIEVLTVDALTECDVGVWEGSSWDEIERRDSEHFEAFEADPANVPYAGGESFQQVQDRVVPAIDKLVHDSSGDLVVVTHNIVARVAIAKSLELATAKARGIQVDNAGISVLSVRGERIKLLTLNSVLHLNGLMTPP